VAPARARQLLALVAVGAFLATVDAPILSVAMPSLAEAFPTTPLTDLAWVLDAYFVAFGAMLLTSGRLADRFSRPGFLLGGLAVFAVASVACALAPSANALIAARVVQALGGAAILPAGQAILLSVNPPGRRYAAITTLGTIVALGSALAPTLGGLLVEYLSWPWIFWISAAGATVAFVLGTRIVPRESGDRSVRIPDVVGTTSQAFGLALLVYAILGTDRWGLADPRVLAAFALAVVGVGLSVWRSRTHVAPAIHLSLFADRRIALSNVASFGLGLGLFGYSFAAVLFLTQQWGYGPLEVGLAMVPGAVASAIGGKSAPLLAARIGAARLGAFAGMLSATGMAMLVLMVAAEPGFWSSFVPGQIVGGLGMAAALTTAVALSIMSAPVERFAAASGINGALRQVGGAVGVAIVAAVFGRADFGAIANVRLSWSVTAFAVLVGTVALAAAAQLPELARGDGVPADQPDDEAERPDDEPPVGGIRARLGDPAPPVPVAAAPGERSALPAGRPGRVKALS
jgi:EmrB/QacA subfamily drug resistance transporter